VDAIIYLVGLIVVVMAVLSFFGLRWAARSSDSRRARRRCLLPCLPPPRSPSA